MIDAKRMQLIRDVQSDGINGYNTLSSRDYCVMLEQVLGEHDLMLEHRDELWGLLCPDAGPSDHAAIVASIKALLKREAEVIEALDDTRSPMLPSNDRSAD